MPKRMFFIAAFGFLAAGFILIAERPGMAADPATVDIPKKAPANPQAAIQEQRAALAARQYRGLIVTPHADAAGDELQLQMQIGAELERLDFAPAERIRHFKWLDQFGATVTGWDATIMSTEQVPGGVSITLRIYPKHTAGGVAAVNGYAVEQYFYNNDGLLYIQSENRTAKVLTIN